MCHEKPFGTEVDIGMVRGGKNFLLDGRPEKGVIQSYPEDVI